MNLAKKRVAAKSAMPYLVLCFYPGMCQNSEGIAFQKKQSTGYFKILDVVELKTHCIIPLTDAFSTLRFRSETLSLFDRKRVESRLDLT